MAGYDFKKEQKNLYNPKTTPSLIDVPEMTFIAISGCGNPNEEGGEYSVALGVLYGLCYTIKMSKMDKSGRVPEGYFDYVVPPLEGLWWMEGLDGIDYSQKENFSWISMIRQPDFVNEAVFAGACESVIAKKGLDPQKAKLVKFTEGLCVQCMHIGAFDDEPATLDKIHAFIAEKGLLVDISELRRHHEIYLGDPRKGDPAKHKTIMRIPVREA